MHRALAMLLAALALLGPLLAPTSALASTTHASTTRIPERLVVAQNRTIGNFRTGTAQAEGHPLFLQRDPDGYAHSVSLYAAFNNAPINHRDPTGRSDSILLEWFDDATALVSGFEHGFGVPGQERPTDPDRAALFDKGQLIRGLTALASSA